MSTANHPNSCAESSCIVYEPERRAWDNILGAMYDRAPDAIAALPSAFEDLQAIVDDPQVPCGGMHDLNARLTLGSRDIIKDIVHGRAVSQESQRVQRDGMALLLHDMTAGTYELSNVEDPRFAVIARRAILFSLTARQEPNTCYAYPSPPFTQKKGYYDRQHGIAHHHLYIVTAAGAAAVYVASAKRGRTDMTGRVLTIELGERFVETAIRSGESIFQVSRRAGSLNKGKRALVNLAARSIGREYAGEKLDDDTLHWLRRSGRLLVDLADEHSARQNAGVYTSES